MKDSKERTRMFGLGHFLKRYLDQLCNTINKDSAYARIEFDYRKLRSKSLLVWKVCKMFGFNQSQVKLSL